MSRLHHQPSFDLALQHHQSGRLTEAEAMYREVLRRQPNDAASLHYLGVLFKQHGKLEAAVDSIRKAIAIQPNYAEAYSNLGSVLNALGKFDEAIFSLERAIAINPNLPGAHGNLGVALSAKGCVDESIASYRRAVSLNPNYAEAFFNLGNSLRDRGDIDEAIAAYQQSIALNPRFAEAFSNLGNLLAAKLQRDEAVAAYQQSIALRPAHALTHFNLANALRDKRQVDEAIAAYRTAIDLRPDYFEAVSNLGNMLKDNGRLDEAIVASRRAIDLKPQHPDAHLSLGNALKDKGEMDGAIIAYQRAVDIDPAAAQAHNNLGNALKDLGQHDLAIASYRRAIAASPETAAYHSNLILGLHYSPSHSAQDIAEECKRWDQQHGWPLRGFIKQHANDRDPDRPLKIGYVSPDFREHVVGQNILPLFLQHDRQQFHITCYADVATPDSLTHRLEQQADRWRSIKEMADAELAEQIREDEIDILVDLALHTAGNRLPLFARKPAPVQVTFAGYPGRTGVSAIDYRLSDRYLDPETLVQKVVGESEQTLRALDSFWCYDPMHNRDLQVNALPAMASGAITFGCLNYFSKINDAHLARWAEVLQQVPGSRLLLLADPGSHQARVQDLFRRETIDPCRIEFAGRRSLRAYLELYHRIDVGLDTFPYNGHTTSLDSFWMGVPVVTLVGNTPVSRAGWCQLSNLGLQELAGQTPEQFVQIAVGLAHDFPRLQSLRASLRQRMERSPLMDAPRFARNIENAYRQMWRSWCAP